MVVRLFSLQRTRDHYTLAVLSFLMVLAASVLTVGSVFLFSFAVFLLIAIVAFVLMEMQHSVASEPTHAQDQRAASSSAVSPRVVSPSVVSPTQRMAHALLAIAPALMLMILGGEFPDLLPASPRYVTLLDRLQSGERCFHRLHRSRATGPYR